MEIPANVEKCAAMISHDSKVEEVDCKGKWGNEELSRVDQYTYLSVEFWKDCVWGAHVKNLT